MFATVTALLVSSVAVFILFSKTNSFFSSAGMFYGAASVLGSTTNTKRWILKSNMPKAALISNVVPEGLYIRFNIGQACTN